ncbi:hypothetical protein ACI2L4_10095 [Streptomyces sparsogenes]|uniref:hypothetical protein n=1 Tax=Streptomyces sparsogenes TaxID=67365 RepID=UPI00384B444C
MKTAGTVICAILITVMTMVAMPLLVLMMIAVGSDANAETCTAGLQATGNGESGPGKGGSPEFEGERADRAQIVVPLQPHGDQETARWGKEQLRNASTITNVARTRNLAPRAAVIAVATAMQESSLNNLEGGDRDSAGLFQQRPSQGWGTLDQVTDPVHASRKFYDALVKISEWQTKPLSKVAQAVQRSAFPSAYARWEQSAGAVVAKTWGTHAVTSIFSGCDDAPSGPSGEDTNAKFRTKNPRSVAQAIAGARHLEGDRGWYRRCDNFVAQAYGHGSSGSATANVHWNRLVDAGLAHPGDNAPPPGALLFYDTGETAGHVALYLGNDQVASNDILDAYKGEGKMAIVRRKEITDGRWRLRYRGWAEPSFPSAGGASTIPLPLPDEEAH